MTRQKRRRVNKKSRVNYELIKYENVENRDGKRAVGYSRVSTKDQVDKISLEHQENEITRWAVYKDFDIVNMYVERGESGAKEDRTQLTKLLEDAKERTFDMVVVYSPDRFSRDFRIAMETVFKLEDLNVHVKFLNPDFSTADETGKLMLSFYAYFAERDRESIRQRLIIGKRDKVKQGNYIAKKPYGYLLTNGKLLPHPEESKVIQDIFKWKKYNKMSLRKISDKLFELRVPSPTEKERWSVSTISKILKNRLYLGELSQVIDGEEIRITNNHQKIVDERVFGRLV